MKFNPIVLAATLLSTGLFSIGIAPGLLAETADGYNNLTVNEGEVKPRLVPNNPSGPTSYETRLYNRTGNPVYVDYDFNNKEGYQVRKQDIRIEDGYYRWFETSGKILLDFDYDIYSPGVQVKTENLKKGYNYYLYLNNYGEIYVVEGSKI